MSKKFKVLIILVIISGLVIPGLIGGISSSSPGENRYIVIIDTDIPWKGIIGSNTDSQTVNGVGFEIFIIDGDPPLVAIIQKQAEEGKLRVIIGEALVFPDGTFDENTVKKLSSQETTSSYGVVTVSYPS